MLSLAFIPNIKINKDKKYCLEITLKRMNSFEFVIHAHSIKVERYTLYRVKSKFPPSPPISGL